MMRKIYAVSIKTLLLVLLSVPAFAQNSFFKEVSERSINAVDAKRTIRPQKFKTFQSNTAAIENFLQTVSSSPANALNRSAAPVIALPMPDGSMAAFRIWETEVMAPALAAKYPMIKAYAGEGVSDKFATIQLDYSPFAGLRAQVLSPNGNVYIDPYVSDKAGYSISYYREDYSKDLFFRCNTKDAEPSLTQLRGMAGVCMGTQLYTYRLALAATAEYSAYFLNGSETTDAQRKAKVLAGMVTSINRVNGIYEKEISVRLTLIANTDQLIYLNSTSDPYTNNDGNAMLTENENNVNTVIGATNYDIGHVFSTGGGGIAVVGSVCGTSKARGVTGAPSPTGDAYDVDYVAHEIGHQLGARHSFNSITDNCGGVNRSSGTAYEPGSGTTIMAYAGICGSDNLQPNSDPYFHSASIDEIAVFLQFASCAQVTNTGNAIPQITAMNNNGVRIPTQTPFTLTASATDPNGDPLTYDWEEWDLGDAGSWNNGAFSTTAPLFKSRLPKTSGSRTFPDMSVILAGYPVAPPATLNGLKGETLPQIGRTMKFRLTVRDNKGGIVTGGDGCQTGFDGTFQVIAVAATGPFIVTNPSASALTIPGGTTYAITWNVAGTNANGINCSNVKISLSTDGGLTYPTVLAASTPNDGTETLLIPNTATTTARIKIEAVGNIFFDISDNNFTITNSVSNFIFDTPAPAEAACPAPSSMDVTLGVVPVAGFSNTVTLTASGAPAGTTVSFLPGNTVAPGNSVTVRLNNTNILAAGSYTITVSGTASGSAGATRNLTYTIQPGASPTINIQPAAQQSCAGNNATFSITATGALSYQWQFSNNNGASFSDIAGATASSYTATAVAASMDGYLYRVIVSGQCNSITSSAALLTVQTAPAITAQPQAVTLCEGSNHTLSVAATGANLSYQWQLSTNGGATYTTAPGATNSPSYSITSVTPAMNNYRYRVLINGACSPSVTSGFALVNVISPVVITKHPDNVSACAVISTASFTVAGSGTGVLYQWQVSTNGGASYSDIPGATAATYTTDALTDAMNGNRYRAKLYNATCTTPAITNAALLTVFVRPAISLVATSTALLPGQTSTLTATANPATGVSYTWYKDGALINGVTGTSYTADVTKLGNYQVKINNLNNCTNESAVLAINAAASSRLFIYPNSNNGQFTVSYYNSAGTGTQQTITIYDAHGSLVYKQQFPVSGPYQLHPINLQAVSKGVYLVVIGDGNGKRLAQGKVLIQ